jgi:hypothetical protein
VKNGQRNAGQQALEVAISDVSGPEEAAEKVQRFLERNIQL